MISIRNIHKSFGNKEILKGIDLDADKKDVIAIIGPSGTGKTTLLRCINCLEKPDIGTVTIDDISCESPHITKKQVLLLRRKTAMVFQHYNLFKNMNAWENVAEGLITVHKKPKKEAKEAAFAQLRLVGLEGRETAYPYELSGGQQQRVGIARALALQPKVLLFDEPTSSLDPELVGEVLSVMKKVASLGIAMLVVTHEMRFADQVANKVVYMEDGVIVEQGSPRDIFTHPREKATQRFLENTLQPFMYEI
ncbi:amino acid ABC transporter ATP-binding protein [Treponema primitia]|uniref:amino acid ABC transporter ATP-binding protein n=1 Tax=Treponema primitia TaxID=88058 RepID=UPI0002554F94|nr:amino acid ABC transporter ATP-binding protein [Treponema primitia]